MPVTANYVMPGHSRTQCKLCPPTEQAVTNTDSENSDKRSHILIALH